jgi:hypothetical protein
MNSKVAEQLLDELLPTFEAIDTQNSAVLEFLKTQGLATEDQLAPFLERAKSASTIRWRALRLRMERLLSSAARSEEAREPKTQKGNFAADEAEARREKKDVEVRPAKPNEKRAVRDEEQRKARDEGAKEEKPAA